MNFPDFVTPDGRRAWAFLAIVGGCMVFTAVIIGSLWLIKDHDEFVFYLALAAHVQVLVGMTALGWAMGRRLQASASRDGVTINDSQIEVHSQGK
jgi:apolipoprotein N-acyltransferase